MKKIISLLIILVSVCYTAYSQEENGNNEINNNSTMKKRILITYFSATGTTKRAAERIAGITGGDVHEIVPQQIYTDADLNRHNRQSRSSLEMNDETSRPAIKDNNSNISDYDVILIGFPIWWNLPPRIINTFIESHDLKGKNIALFATSGGSSITNSVSQMKKDYPSLDWKEGLLVNNINEKSINSWIEKVSK